MLRKGDRSERVAELQRLLNKVGYNLIVDGHFGNRTESTVIAFQISAGIIADGIAGPVTMDMLHKAIAKPAETPALFSIHYLKQGQYQLYPAPRFVGVTLHHTVSDGNPDAVIYTWNNDNRLAATNSIIGRKEDNGNTRHDGRNVLAMPLNAWGYHMETRRIGRDKEHNERANSSYFSIELCSWGCLTLRNGRYYNAYGKEIAPAEVCTLEKPFRTFLHWHRYTDAQMHALWEQLNFISETFNIDFTDLTYEPEIVNSQWWEMDWNAINFLRKLTTHTNFEHGKFDTFPQPELIEVIKSVRGGK